MTLNIRNPQPDEPSRTTTANIALQILPLPSQGTLSIGGAPISTDTTALSSPSPTVILHPRPSTSKTELSPLLFTNPPSTTDAIAPTFSQDPQAPVNADSTPSASATATAQPSALPASQSSGISQSQIVAAVLIPIIALLIILVPIACIYTRRRRRLRRSAHVQPAREMKPLSPTTTAGWMPMTSPVEHGIARRPVPTLSQTQIQEPDVIPRRTPTMNSGYYSGLDQSATQHQPPAVDDPPPPYVPRTPLTQTAPALTSLNVSPPVPAMQRQMQPATLSEANLITHAAGAGTEGPRSPFEDPDGDGVSEISSLGEERSPGPGIRRDGGRARDVDEVSLISAPDLITDRRRSGGGVGMEMHQIV